MTHYLTFSVSAYVLQIVILITTFTSTWVFDKLQYLYLSTVLGYSAHLCLYL